MIQSLLLFLVAGLFEIGGGYLFWLWLREGKSVWLAVIGVIILALYGVVPTLCGLWRRFYRVIHLLGLGGRSRSPRQVRFIGRVDRATGRFGHHVRAPVLAVSLQISSRSICRAIAGLTPLVIVFLSKSADTGFTA
jgi:hypothetical protein